MQKSIFDRIRWQYQCHLSISFWTSQQTKLAEVPNEFLSTISLGTFLDVVVIDR